MRPGGLTALAIFNFIFGGLGALGNLIGLGMLAANPDQFEQAAKSGAEIPSTGALYAIYGLGIIESALLIMSGIGYLQLKKFLGRTLGNSYTIVAIGSSVLLLSLYAEGFQITNLISFVYPVITLFLLNTIFRKDFIR